MQTITSSYANPATVIAFPSRKNQTAKKRTEGRRWISPQNGRAIEILAHAIEYLADEYAVDAEQMGRIDVDDPKIEAIHRLMAANREVYYSCPRVEPVLRRLARWAFSRGNGSLPSAQKFPA